MWRAALGALLFSGLCLGCEDSEFYQADTHSWFGPYAAPASTAAPTPVAGQNRGNLDSP